MTRFRSFLGISLLASFAAAPALAQGGSTDQFPDVCKSDTAHAAGHAMPAQPEAEKPAMNEYAEASMPGMEEMNQNMMQGMMKEDADVAFVCGMIAHHLGAIDMAQVELDQGDDEWAKAMAQKIIDDQTREIDEMKGWLEEHAN